jgi:flagellar secretion chaperone FliS
MSTTPWSTYRQIATQTAPPGQLILMLYDGALRFLEQGLTGFSHTDPGQFNMTIHNNFQRARTIIQELNRILDMERGGECAATLRRLYDYFERRIWESNLKKRPEGAKEVVGHLMVLRGAWATMLRHQTNSEKNAGEPLAAAMAIP